MSTALLQSQTPIEGDQHLHEQNQNHDRASEFSGGSSQRRRRKLTLGRLGQVLTKAPSASSSTPSSTSSVSAAGQNRDVVGPSSPEFVPPSGRARRKKRPPPVSTQAQPLPTTTDKPTTATTSTPAVSNPQAHVQPPVAGPSTASLGASSPQERPAVVASILNSMYAHPPLPPSRPFNPPGQRPNTSDGVVRRSVSFAHSAFHSADSHIAPSRASTTSSSSSRHSGNEPEISESSLPHPTTTTTPASSASSQSQNGQTLPARVVGRGGSGSRLRLMSQAPMTETEARLLRHQQQQPQQQEDDHGPKLVRPTGRGGLGSRQKPVSPDTPKLFASLKPKLKIQTSSISISRSKSSKSKGKQRERPIAKIDFRHPISPAMGYRLTMLGNSSTSTISTLQFRGGNHEPIDFFAEAQLAMEGGGAANGVPPGVVRLDSGGRGREAREEDDEEDDLEEEEGDDEDDTGSVETISEGSSSSFRARNTGATTPSLPPFSPTTSTDDIISQPSTSTASTPPEADIDTRSILVFNHSPSSGSNPGNNEVKRIDRNYAKLQRTLGDLPPDEFFNALLDDEPPISRKHLPRLFSADLPKTSATSKSDDASGKEEKRRSISLTSLSSLFVRPSGRKRESGVSHHTMSTLTDDLHQLGIRDDLSDSWGPGIGHDGSVEGGMSNGRPSPIIFGRVSPSPQPPSKSTSKASDGLEADARRQRQRPKGPRENITSPTSPIPSHALESLANGLSTTADAPRSSLDSLDLDDADADTDAGDEDDHERTPVSENFNGLHRGQTPSFSSTRSATSMATMSSYTNDSQSELASSSGSISLSSVYSQASYVQDPDDHHHRDDYDEDHTAMIPPAPAPTPTCLPSSSLSHPSTSSATSPPSAFPSSRRFSRHGPSSSLPTNPSSTSTPSSSSYSSASRPSTSTSTSSSHYTAFDMLNSGNITTTNWLIPPRHGDDGIIPLTGSRRPSQGSTRSYPSDGPSHLHHADGGGRAMATGTGIGNETWVGAWNRNNLQDVIQSLRELR